jgi:hypothetical protein
VARDVQCGFGQPLSSASHRDSMGNTRAVHTGLQNAEAVRHIRAPRGVGAGARERLGGGGQRL